MRTAERRSHPTATMVLVAMTLAACGSEPDPVAEKAPPPPVRELVEQYIDGASDAPGWSEARSRMGELDMEDALDRILVRKALDRRLAERPHGVVGTVDEIRQTSQELGAQVPWRTLLEQIESCAGQDCAPG
ncbi:MAG: hypothetical protein QGG40_15510, partial [Myxococcota bacterium]|nr:hypothetical protein [Myxococcota bacterium]